jgi:hypothetical protein
MGAPKGNNFWTLRSKHGRDLLFTDPLVLLKAAGEYFEQVDANPWYKKEAIRGGDLAGKIIDVPTQLPYTQKGLCHFLDIEEQTWENYGEREEFAPTIRRINAYIYNQKFSGAAIGAFNANIIARELGLKEHTDATSNGESLGMGFFELLKKARTIKPEAETPEA